MSRHNESSSDIKYYFEVEWGVPKKIYLDKFLFGSNYSVEINNQKQFPQNPVYLYPEDRNGMDANLAVKTLKEFYDTGSILPRCSIAAEVLSDKRIQLITSYRFQNVKVLELFGKRGDRFSWFYKIQFSQWL